MKTFLPQSADFSITESAWDHMGPLCYSAAKSDRLVFQASLVLEVKISSVSLTDGALIHLGL